MFRIGSDFYVQVWRDRVRVENLKTGRQAEELIEWPHSAVLFGDFHASEAALRQAIRTVSGNWFWDKPGTLLMHVQDDLGHDLSHVETRAVRDAAVYVGAKLVYLILEPRRFSSQDARNIIRGTASAELMELRSYGP